MNDVNKGKRKTMWWAVVIFLAAIPFIRLTDGSPINENELSSIYGLRLSSDATYIIGNKNSNSAIWLETGDAKKTFVIRNNALKCVDHREILDNFKAGDVFSVLVKKEDVEDISNRTMLSKLQPIYGLTKNGREYISLDCRNKTAQKSTRNIIIANVLAALAAAIFALFRLKPRTRMEDFGSFPIHPIIVVVLIWLLIAFALPL